jgi:hypothetical protein
MELKYFVIYLFSNYHVKAVKGENASYPRGVAQDCYLEVRPKAQ